MPKIRRKSIENDFLLIFFCMQSEGAAQSSILMILRHPLFCSIPLLSSRSHRGGGFSPSRKLQEGGYQPAYAQHCVKADSPA